MFRLRNCGPATRAFKRTDILAQETLRAIVIGLVHNDPGNVGLIDEITARHAPDVFLLELCRHRLSFLQRNVQKVNPRNEFRHVCSSRESGCTVLPIDLDVREILERSQRGDLAKQIEYLACLNVLQQYPYRGCPS